MPAGTPTLLDSYWLSQSSIFKQRVQSALLQICTQINSEAINSTMPIILHQARKQFVAAILNPNQFANWLTQFVGLASVDNSSGGVIQSATNSAVNYVAITSAAQGDTASANITDTVLENAISAAFNTLVASI